MRKKSRKKIEEEYYQRTQKHLTEFFKKRKMDDIVLKEVKE